MPTQPSIRSLLQRWWPLGLALVAACLLRLCLWGNLPRQGMVSDEAEYFASAVWLAQGRGFSWHQEWLWTRAPLYPLFLAIHIRLFGIATTPIYVSQFVLGLLQVVLTYLLAMALVPASARADDWRRWVPGLSALLLGLLFPLAVYYQVLLSETLYITIVLAGLLALVYWVRSPAYSSRRAYLWLALAGLLFGLASLTRSLALGFVVVAAGWVFLTIWQRVPAALSFKERTLKSLLPAAIPLVLAGMLIAPWSLYASRSYGGFVAIDTTGAFNLLLGARTAYDGDRKDAPTRNFVLALLNPQMSQKERGMHLGSSCLAQHKDARLFAALERPSAEISQAERQQLMTAEGLCLLRERPLAFVQKSLAELIDFFRINYGGDERFTDGFTTGRLQPSFVLATFLLDDTLYVLTLPLAIIGWALLRKLEKRDDTALLASSTLIAWWLLYNLLTAPLLFAINRFRVPLLPMLLILAAYALLALGAKAWKALDRRQAPHLVLALLMAFVVTAPASWISAYNPQTASYRAQESYFGPHPSSVADTYLALSSRDRYLASEELRSDLAAGRLESAKFLLDSGRVDPNTVLLARAIIEGMEGRPEAGLGLFPSEEQLALADRAWQARAAVVRGDLLRRLGLEREAKNTFTPRVVDDYNPVEWAWDWLQPSPPSAGRIDFGGNLDLGYIRGFYLGEGDGTDTWRWSMGEAALRFSQMGSGAPQTLRLRIDGLSSGLPEPRLTLAMGGQVVAELALKREVAVYELELPATPQGEDVIVELRSPVFVPSAADLLAQQGPKVGQLRLLGVRLDWAELE